MKREDRDLESTNRFSRRPLWKTGVRNALVLGLVLFTVAYVYPALLFPTSRVPRDDSQSLVMPSYRLDDEIAHNLGPYGPRYAVPGKISSEVPKGCDVTMVSVLQRHGARYPTKSSGKAIELSLAKLRRVTNIMDKSLQFVSTFDYSYNADQLNDFGRKQSYVSGQIIAKKYASLRTDAFVRAAKKDRIVESARWWIQGFRGGAYEVSNDSLPQPDVSIVISNKSYKSNNTLLVKTCPAADATDPTRGDVVRRHWLGRFAPPITQRLNNLLPGARLNDNDTINLMSLCGFDTSAKNGDASPWCGVFDFDRNVWKSNEYYYDLEKYYARSYGSAYARSQGVGWVTELLSRLNNTLVEDHTSTDSTLNSNPATFPIGPSAPRIFADFSSDNNIAKILSALGIFRDAQDLPPDGPIPQNQQFVVSKIVPFAGATVVEKLSCPAFRGKVKEYVRILVNDAVVPLTYLTPCGEMGRTKGLCELDKFIESQAYAIAGGIWPTCFV